MKEDVYWSSSELLAYGSWGVYFNDGYVDNGYSKCGSGCVRPCTAFEL